MVELGVRQAHNIANVAQPAEADLQGVNYLMLDVFYI